PLPATDNGGLPFWSPDSRSVGFFAAGKLKRIDIDSGSLQTLTDANAAGGGGAWNTDGMIFFGKGGSTPIFRISARGGMVVPVTRLEARQNSHPSPQLLSDGRHFIYYVSSGSTDIRGVYTAQVDGSDPKRLLDADAAPIISGDQLLFVRQGTLLAQ